MLDGKVALTALVQVPLRMMNRHGLIAGATGTGKTKGLQGMAEQLSEAGVAVFAADMKGDLSGLSQPGGESGIAADRWKELGETFTPTAYPVEYLALGGIGPGDPGPRDRLRLRAAPARQDPPGERDAGAEPVAAVPLRRPEGPAAPRPLRSARSLLTFLASEDGKAELTGIGGVASATIGVLLRQLVQLEDGGGTEFFGEPQLEIADLMRTAPDGRGIISCLELPAVQDKPTLFSTALMWLLAELFEELPEIGDRTSRSWCSSSTRPTCCSTAATKAFLDSIVQTVRLIRSKGVGVFFCTQQPKDIPADVLAQLGNRVQYALRAFTPDDAKALKATVSTFPRSDFYDLAELLTQLGIGEAAVTILGESGVPTPVVATKIRAPRSKMAAADDVDAAAKASPLFAKYGTRVDAQSARELLAARLAQQPTAAAADRGAQEGGEGGRRRSGRGRRLPQVDDGPPAAARGRPRPLRPALEVAQVRPARRRRASRASRRGARAAPSRRRARA